MNNFEREFMKARTTVDLSVDLDYYIAMADINKLADYHLFFIDSYLG